MRKLLQQCKFCGCTEDKPCVFRAPDPGAPPFELWPCAWLLPDVCTAPACVEKAYAEARLLAESIMFLEAA
jgi:hypothetical protein